MAKINKTTRVYITIEVDEPWAGSSISWTGMGIRKRDEVYKLLYASNIGGLGGVDYEFETPTVCSFCGREWEEDQFGWPQCCDAAQEEYRKEKGIE